MDSILYSDRYLIFRETTNALFLEPKSNGQQEARYLLANRANFGHGSVDDLFDMLEGALGNGWSGVPPEDIGALTDATIISQDGFLGRSTSARGSVDGHWYPLPDLDAPVVYAHMNYMVEDPIETWAAGKAVRFVKEVLVWTPAGRSKAQRKYAEAQGTAKRVVYRAGKPTLLRW